MKDEASNIRTAARPASVLARSFLIGGSWNDSAFQNVGFLYTILPAVDAGKGRRGEFLARHLDVFSSHPIMASLIAASVLKAEELGNGANAVRIKQVLAGPYAAMGDPFFWGSLRPLCALVGLCAAFIWGWILAPLLVVVLFNLAHGYIRIGGFFKAYRDGLGAMRFLERLRLPEKGKALQWLSLVIAALFAGAFVTVPLFQDASAQTPALGGLVVLATILGCLGLLKKGVPVPVILYGVAAVLFLVAS